MDAALKDSRRKPSQTVWGQMPARMRVLFVTGAQRTGNWLAEAFTADSACEVTLERAVGVAQGLALLRDEVYDAVLISHEGDQLDALAVLEAVRTGSREDQPIVVLGTQSEEEMSALCFEAGGDAYVCVNTTTTRTLLWKIAFARERHLLIAENRRMRHAQRHQLQLEHDEATRLLRQQRDMLSDLESLYASSRRTTGATEQESLDLPQALIGHYRELLRAYVIMGSGNLGEEMSHLGELLICANVAPQQVLRLHLVVLEEMVHGLGNRSARHVMNRADMLILEVMINLAEGFRDRCQQRLEPLRQRWLPGLDDCALRDGSPLA
jgi:DNA-binding response OmpR family regulator